MTFTPCVDKSSPDSYYGPDCSRKVTGHRAEKKGRRCSLGQPMKSTNGMGSEHIIEPSPMQPALTGGLIESLERRHHFCNGSGSRGRITSAAWTQRNTRRGSKPTRLDIGPRRDRRLPPPVEMLPIEEPAFYQTLIKRIVARVHVAILADVGAIENSPRGHTPDCHRVFNSAGAILR